MNQQKKGYNPSPYRNTTKSFPRKDFYSNPPNKKGSGKPVNLGMKRLGDSSHKPLKCLECGEPYLKRNYPHLSSTNRTIGHNLKKP
jgi:hypothetical protein